MDSLDNILLFLRPIIFVILPAWGFHAWIGEATLGAVIGFQEVREQLDELKTNGV